MDWVAIMSLRIWKWIHQYYNKFCCSFFPQHQYAFFLLSLPKYRDDVIKYIFSAKYQYKFIFVTEHLKGITKWYHKNLSSSSKCLSTCTLHFASMFKLKISHPLCYTISQATCHKLYTRQNQQLHCLDIIRMVSICSLLTNQQSFLTLDL